MVRLKNLNKNKKQAILKYLNIKFGYKMKFNDKEKLYIFKTNNIKGIESRFIEVVHRKKRR